MHNKISICYNIEDVRAILNNNPDTKFCLYLAFKTEEEWNKSTSRVYMNQIDKKFIYLPVNIRKNDTQMLESIYRLSEETPQIVAINQTHPHKSNAVLQEWFKGQDIPINVDALVKDKNGKLQLYDLNGPSFTDWFEAEVGNFKNKQIVVLGVGGVGEPIARIISTKQPDHLFLVDLIQKTFLVKELSNLVSVSYASSIDNIPFLSGKIIFINCTGKEGVSETGIIKFLDANKGNKNIFVDLRPQLNIDIVKEAQQLGWISYTGFGMNSRNDYTLLLKICSLVKIKPPLFKSFKMLVAAAS